MKSLPKITFINHASVLVEHENISILSDPWYSGSAFNDGWRLLAETPEDQVLKILNSLSHIWVSHEHPDHLSILFFKTYSNLLKANDITILFQKTPDKRVYKFLSDTLSLRVVELPDCEWVTLAQDFSLAVKRFGLYDSALFINSGGTLIANLNDCHLTDRSDLGALKKSIVSVDVLLTQFSYASWKSDYRARSLAAKTKLDTLTKQADILGAKFVVPFASYIYFSARDNAYMNDAINTPSNVRDVCGNGSGKFTFLIPYYNEQVFPIHNEDAENRNAENASKWDLLFENCCKEINRSDKIEKAEECLNKIEGAVEACNKRLTSKNSPTLFRLLNFLRITSPVYFEIEDTNYFVLYSPLIKFELHTEPLSKPDIILSLGSFCFLLKHDFGLDTLSVNGRFTEGEGGFKKLVKSFFFGSLNAAGISASIVSLAKPSVILLVLPKALAILRGRF